MSTCGTAVILESSICSTEIKSEVGCALQNVSVQRLSPKVKLV